MSKDTTANYKEQQEYRQALTDIYHRNLKKESEHAVKQKPSKNEDEKHQKDSSEEDYSDLLYSMFF